MSKLPQYVFDEPARWLGDCHPLAEQLECAGALATPGAVSRSLRFGPVEDFTALRHCLRAYHERLLLPLELPAIGCAFGHAARNQLRELLRFDRQLAHEPLLSSLAEPSRRIGRLQLRRLRPLRDVRFIQRYLGAVEQDRAHAWHTLVYGVTLAVFSLPLRQGLLGYTRQTTLGFIDAAAGTLGLSEQDRGQLVDEFCGSVPAAVTAAAGPPALL